MERDLCRLIAKGMSNKEIAERWHRPEASVGREIHKLFRGFNLHNRTELACKYYQEVAVAALIKIAAFDDAGANERLRSTRSYSLFDEPGSVETSRKALSELGVNGLTKG